MKTFETKEFLNELDKMGVVYTIDSNPSPEKIERLKKSIEKRDLRIKQMVEDYRSGKFDEVIKSLQIKFQMWESWLIRYTWNVQTAGSSPVIQTKGDCY